MRYPEYLKDNGTIGFVAPSLGCATEPYKSCFDNALNKFKKRGFDLDLGPNCYEDKGIGISNTPKLCGKELTEYYCSNDNDILISCGGGEMMCEILPYVDFDRIRSAMPKWFMGYSDNTNFTFLLTTLCDVASVYGPSASSYGMEPWHESLEHALMVLQGKMTTVKNYDKWEKEKAKDESQPYLPYNVTEPVIIKRFPDEPVHMEGRLVGGCLDCLVNLLGTSFDKVDEFNEKYKEDGIIWFLEACDLNPMGIRRAIWQMQNAGWFKYVKGFLIGRPLCLGQEFLGCNPYNAITDLLRIYEVPIVMDLDIGHFSPMMPIICGAKARVDSWENNITIEYTKEV